MDHIDLTLVDAFTRTAGNGNRAAIVIGADLDDDAMHALATRAKAAATAFVVPGVTDGRVAMRFFTAADEIGFCGHATTAAFHLLAERGLLPVPGRYDLVCRAGTLAIDLEATGTGCRVWTAPPLPSTWSDSPIAMPELLALLGGSPAWLDPELAPGFGGGRAFVPIQRRADLWALAPRFAALAREGAAHGLAGVYAFTREVQEAGSVAHGRYFTPLHGVPEDAVTGSAIGPLGAWLAARGVLALPESGGTVRARIEQGDAMGQPGRAELEVSGRPGQVDRVRVGGVALTLSPR